MKYSAHDGGPRGGAYYSQHRWVTIEREGWQSPTDPTQYESRWINVYDPEHARTYRAQECLREGCEWVRWTRVNGQTWHGRIAALAGDRNGRERAALVDIQRAAGECGGIMYDDGPRFKEVDRAP